MVDQCDDDIYSGAVSIESLRIGFLISQLNDLNICAGDISNAYLFAKAKNKVYFIAGKEFGKNMVDKVLIIDKALYGLPLSGFQFHHYIARNLKTMGFLPSKSDRDFWMRGRGDHYEYIACIWWYKEGFHGTIQDRTIKIPLEIDAYEQEKGRLLIDR